MTDEKERVAFYLWRNEKYKGFEITLWPNEHAQWEAWQARAQTKPSMGDVTVCNESTGAEVIIEQPFS